MQYRIASPKSRSGKAGSGERSTNVSGGVEMSDRVAPLAVNNADKRAQKVRFVETPLRLRPAPLTPEQYGEMSKLYEASLRAGPSVRQRLDTLFSPKATPDLPARSARRDTPHLCATPEYTAIIDNLIARITDLEREIEQLRSPPASGDSARGPSEPSVPSSSTERQ
jgi:hypothetical protein